MNTVKLSEMLKAADLNTNKIVVVWTNKNDQCKGDSVVSNWYEVTEYCDIDETFTLTRVVWEELYMYNIGSKQYEKKLRPSIINVCVHVDAIDTDRSIRLSHAARRDR